MNDKERRDSMIVRAIISSSLMFLMFVTAIAFAVATDIPTFDKARTYLDCRCLGCLPRSQHGWLSATDIQSNKKENHHG